MVSCSSVKQGNGGFGRRVRRRWPSWCRGHFADWLGIHTRYRPRRPQPLGGRAPRKEFDRRPCCVSFPVSAAFWTSSPIPAQGLCPVWAAYSSQGLGSILSW